jgi:hypothetical protein
MRPRRRCPVGILIDDAGRHSPTFLDTLLRELAGLPHVLVAVTAREEDIFPVASLSTVAVVRPRLDESLADQLWQRLVR